MDFKIFLPCTIVITLIVMFVPLTLEAKQKDGISLVVRIDDLKEFKKILRTKTNILFIFSKSEKEFTKSTSLFGSVATAMKGKATLVRIECGEAKKLCKKLRVSPTHLDLKHYKDGEFNKDYDRKMEVKSMVNFLTDPTGDIPWEEESNAGDVVHIDEPNIFNRFLKKEKLPVLVMFYAPWCGFCKKLKPDFAAAATELKGEAALVGIDVEKSQAMQFRMDYNITGFPTLYYLINGEVKYKYGGENSKDGIVSWMHDPKPPEDTKKESEWEDETDAIAFLNDDNFNDFVSTNPSVLVMFYAPWCGHCKKMKPEYDEAAKAMKAEKISGILAAVDSTKAKKISEEFGIKGFPTVKYFRDGEFAWDLNERTGDKILDFMKDPKEPPPPPPPEEKWEDQHSNIMHLSDDTFKSFLKKRKHVLLMFYAPWCGHCKKAKPEFTAAAEKFKSDPKVAFTAIDCTIHTATCSSHDVTGYPTFKYFNYGKNSKSYMGGREENDFVKFMQDPLDTGMESQQKPVKDPSEDWIDVTGSENIHFLTDDTFDSFLQDNPSTLVMFYAPWCGHCKNMKPDYGEAATIIENSGSFGALAAVDATENPGITEKYQIKGFPSLKLFKNGKHDFDYTGPRKAESIVNFMKSPKAPAPPEPAWSSIPSAVKHLSQNNFTSFLAERNTLVMFYAPWCGHCKKAKPEFQNAADFTKGDDSVHFAAIDCTVNKDICKTQGVDGYPKFKFFKMGNQWDYKGGRTQDDFLKFIRTAVKQEL